MESYFFPIFLIVLAVLVVWLFRRAQGGSDRRERSNFKGTTTSQRGGRHGPAAWREPLGEDHKAKDVWHPKRERVLKETFTESATERGIIHAGYIGPYANSARKLHSKSELREQDISEAEHLGIDEYLNKREREMAEKAAKEAREDSLTMTAVKYEPAEVPSGEEEKQPRRQRGFKP